MIQLGLIGWPVAHSLSPRLQNAALGAVGLDGAYNLYPIDPTQSQLLGALLERVRTGELIGLNVTIPHKQAVIPFLDDLTPSARAIGAVNTIYMQKDQLLGHNTDAPGFLADLYGKFFKPADEQTPDLAKRALVLGAGGSARAIVWALVQAGWQVTVAARRVEKAVELAESVALTTIAQAPSAALLTSDGLAGILCAGQLIVNATSVGMSPKIEYSPWPENLAFPVNGICYDLVYNPRKTLFVKQARAAGLRAVSGLGMLVEQAALGFEIWTGRSAPRDAMFAAVEA